MTRSDVEDFSALLAALYGGVRQDDPWQDFLTLVRDKIDAQAVTLILRPLDPTRSGVMMNAGGTVQFAQDYQQQFYAFDPFVGLKPGAVVTLSEFIPASELEDSEFYRSFLSRSGSFYILGVDLPTQGVDARFRITRTKDGREFNDAEKEFVRLLVPHLQMAVEFYTHQHRLESERDLYAGAVNQLSVGTLILDADSKVLDMNRQAEKILALEDGIRVINEHLDLSTPSKTAELRDHIKTVLSTEHKDRAGFAQAIRVERPSGALDFSLMVKPVPAAHWLEGKAIPAVAIFVADPAGEVDAVAETLAILFGLTPTEATVSLLLANGLSLDEAAEDMGVARNTVRAHLRSIFSKTGVSKQTQLVRLVLKSVAELA